MVLAHVAAMALRGVGSVLEEADRTTRRQVHSPYKTGFVLLGAALLLVSLLLSHVGIPCDFLRHQLDGSRVLDPPVRANLCERIWPHLLVAKTWALEEATDLLRSAFRPRALQVVAVPPRLTRGQSPAGPQSRDNARKERSKSPRNRKRRP